MQALFWISLCVAVYFLLRLFDPDGKKVREKHKPEPKPGSSTKPKSAPQPRVAHNPNAPVQELKFFCVKDKGYHVSVWPKDVYLPDYIEFNIAGITYHSDTAMKHLGENVGYLLPEPDNPHDANAIRIMTTDCQPIGYVPRDMTATIREQVTLPCQCYYYIGHYINGDKIDFYTDAYIDLNKPKTDIIH